MIPIINHSWAVNEIEAIALQKEFAPKVITKDLFDDIHYVAGVDVAYSKNSDKLVAAIVILDISTLDVIEIATAEDKVEFPYIPGLFSFRELPPLIKAFAKLRQTPDLVMCDGQGYAHPRRFGLACHLGLLFDIPTIGCGKTVLLGESQELTLQRGAMVDLLDRGEVIGSSLRTQTNINPIYVSIGHRISLATACHWSLRLTPKYRLPEPIRAADQVVRSFLTD